MIRDKPLESIWKSEHPLNEFVNVSNFKTYEELQTKLNRVLGLQGSAPSTTAESSMEEAPAPVVAKEAPSAPAPEMDIPTDTDGEDEGG